MMKMKGYTNIVKCLAVQGDHLVSGSWDKTICKWNFKGECVAILKGHEHWVRSLAVSNNGILFSGSHDNTIRVWNAFDECIQVLKDAGRVSALKILDGKLFSASYDGTVRCWSGKILSFPFYHSHF